MGFTNDTTTTHPDQHDGIFIPDANGRSCGCSSATTAA
jgi:hypothetical protein